MCPVLEDPAAREQPRHGLRGVVADAARERDPVAALDGRDRVELHAREPADRGLDVRRGRAPVAPREPLRRDREPADGGGADRTLSHVAQSTFLDFAREHLPPAPARVLEVGCGQGELTTALAVSGYDVLGIDPLAPEGEGFRRIRLEDLEPSDGPYDAVVASYSLHHIRDLDHALDLVVELLEPGGVLVLDEFGWDLADEPTLDWLYGQRRALAAAGLGEAPASLEALGDEWKTEHLGLHGFEALRTAVAARFEEREFARMPFFHRQLGGVATRGARAGARRRGRDSGARLPLRRRRAAGRLGRRLAAKDRGQPVGVDVAARDDADELLARNAARERGGDGQRAGALGDDTRSLREQADGRGGLVERDDLGAGEERTRPLPHRRQHDLRARAVDERRREARRLAGLAARRGPR